MPDAVTVGVGVMEIDSGVTKTGDDVVGIIILAFAMLVDGETDVGSTDVEGGVVEIDVEVLDVMVLELLPPAEVWLP